MSIASPFQLFAALGFSALVGCGPAGGGPSCIPQEHFGLFCFLETYAPSLSELNPERLVTDPIVFPLGVEYVTDAPTPSVRITSNALAETAFEGELFAHIPASQYASTALALYDVALVVTDSIDPLDPRLTFACDGDCPLRAEWNQDEGWDVDVLAAALEVTFDEPDAGAWYGVATVSLSSLEVSADGVPQTLSGVTRTWYRVLPCDGPATWCDQVYAPVLADPSALTLEDRQACASGSHCDYLDPETWWP